MQEVTFVDRRDLERKNDKKAEDGKRGKDKER